MSVFRKLLHAASTNAWLRERAMRASFLRRAASSFMPGERVEDALAAAARLQAENVGSILTHLGENLARAEEAESVVCRYLDVLDKVQAAGLDAQISVKPTQLGLDLDEALCAHNLQRLVDRAADRGSFVWIDMESSAYVDRTIELFRHAHRRRSRVGVALQAYLRRTARDIEELLPLGPAIRLVKGAYLEPRDIALQKKAEVDENFFRLACRMLGGEARTRGARLHIATHDHVLINRLGAFIAGHSVPAEAYEYAMLYGIARRLQQRLTGAGWRLRVLISYGEDWFPWYMRRLAERPANVWFAARHLVTR